MERTKSELKNFPIFLCLFVVFGFMRLDAQTQQTSGGAPPYFPQDSTSASRDMPPDTQAPTQKDMSTEQVQQQIQNKLDDERGLKGSTVLATATDAGVILDGQVANQNQHDLALSIAKADAGTRKITDKLQIRSKPLLR
jgi:osmotically-inducible protein OsmY